MSGKAMEDVIDLVKSTIDDNLSTYLDAIETARSVTIPDYAALDTGILKSKQYPAIEVIPGTVEADYSDTPESYLQEHINYFKVAVIVGYPQADYQDAMYVLMRYDEALEELFKDYYDLSGGVDLLRIARADYTEMIQSQRDNQMLQLLTKELEIRDEST